MTRITTRSHCAQVIDPDHYREVMRNHPTGVAAISSLDSATGAPYGLIVGTLASLSLKPALITFSVDRSSTSWSKISRSGKFTVSLLAEGQQNVSEVISRKDDNKFTGLGWSLSSLGTPQIDGALGWIHCTINREVDGGDHVLIIADVGGDERIRRRSYDFSRRKIRWIPQAGSCLNIGAAL